MSSTLIRGPVSRLGRRSIRLFSSSSSTCSPRVLVSSRQWLLKQQCDSARAAISIQQWNTMSSTSRRSFMSTPVGSKDYPPHSLFTMPALSPTMESGTIASWNKGEGDSFSAGDVLCSIETDKASVDFEAQDDGVLAKILRPTGPTSVDIKIGTPICVIVEDTADVSAFADFTVAAEEAASPPAAAVESAPVAADASEQGASSSGSSLLFPSARHLSESKGLDATVLKGTGKGGRVTKGDVITAMAAGSLPSLSKAAATTTTAAPTAPVTATPPAAAAVPTPAAPRPDVAPLSIETLGVFEDIPNNKMRKIIASRLTDSKRNVPHFYTSMEVELDAIMKLRKTLQSQHDVKVSVNDFVIRCSALALRDVPEVNASYDAKSQTVKLSPSIDISVAVATPTGLITPIVFGTDKLGLSQITNTVRDLAGRAREGKLAPHEYQGGTFSISNLGMFGIDEFSAVINPPQAAILAVGGGSKRVVATPYNEDAETQQKPSTKTIMTAKLSADRRVVDEATAALFMSAFRYYVNEPELLML